MIKKKSLDEDAWVQRINRCLGKRKKYSPQQRELFAKVLLKTIPQAVSYREIVSPDNGAVKKARKDVQKISMLVSDFLKRVQTSPFLSDIEQNISATFQHTRGFPADVAVIQQYFCFFSDFIEDTYNFTQKVKIDNMTALAVCQFICLGYERCLNEKPHASDMDQFNYSGSESDGTPYERVCRAVAEQFGINLTWTTQRQATKTYHRGLIDFDEMYRGVRPKLTTST